MLNPDIRLLNDSYDFQSLSDGVLYNTIAWAISGRPTSLYATNAGMIFAFDEDNMFCSPLQFAKVFF